MAAVWNLSLEERRDDAKVSTELARKGAGSEVKETLSVLYGREFRKGMLEITMEAVREGRAEHGKVAALGFSLGGGLALAAAAHQAHPGAVVAYCGEPPKAGLGGTSGPILAIDASQDELLSPKVPPFVDSAMKHENNLTIRVIPNTTHDFFNKTKKDQYNRRAAEAAWELTEWFLAKSLA